MADSLGFARVKTIEFSVDLFEFVTVVGMEIAAVGNLCDIVQRLLIQGLLAGGRRIADTNNVDSDVIVTRDFRSLGWGDAAPRIIAIG